jgi:hypothetical protein
VFPGFFSLLIGIPTVYGGLLAMGIPRVAVMGCLGRRKVKAHDDDNGRSVNGSRRELREHEGAPLLSPTDAAPHARQQVQQPQYFPVPTQNYQAAAPVHNYQAGAPPVHNYQGGPPPQNYTAAAPVQTFQAAAPAPQHEQARVQHADVK